MKNINLLIMCLLVLFLINSCGQQNKETKISDDGKISGIISISGAWALYPMCVKWAEEFKKLHPDLQIDISAGGAGKGMADALGEMVDLGMFSREVTPEEIAKGAWYIAVTKDAVIPTFNVDNPISSIILEKGISKQQFIDIYVTGKITTWKQLYPEAPDTKINVFTRSDACGAAAMWAQYLGKEQEDLLGVGVFGDPGIADAVKNDKNGIGYNNVIYAYDINSRNKYEGLNIIPIDINENGVIDPEEKMYNTLDDIMLNIEQGKYPSPPARDLYFVSKGKPKNEAVIKFLEWILTEGNIYLQDAGYVQLSKEKTEEELKKLK
jgi:phosphate transport system substrate-binding protein